MIKYLLRAFACVVFSLFTLTAYAENANFTTSHFSGSGNCAQCHDNLTDTSGNDVSIVKDWGASMMANATKDPLWRAKVATELERNSHLSAVLNDKCSKCHAPMANYEITQVQGNEITLFGPDGILDPSHEFYDAGMNGVSCTACHQIMDDGNLGTLAGSSGHYSINDTKTIYGQFSDIFGNPMVNSTGYRPEYSAHISDSAMCATCHNLKTPFVDAAGNLLTTTPESEFPEQQPYTEWQNSIFDDAGSNPQSCQDCHMPQTNSKVSNRPQWLGPKAGFSKHELVGSNTTMLTMLRDNAAALDVTSNNMDLGIDRARTMLQNSANVEILSASVTDGILEARVKVLNHSGHKAPTAYPSRRMWLNFKVTDSSNNIVFESGKFNADGSIVGADNDADQTIYEPHYDVITSADQVQIYETIMGNSDSNVTYTLLRGAQYLKDNRLTPQGFDKLNVPSDVAVIGAATDDADFNMGSDEIIYRIPVAASGELTVSVDLNFQTFQHGFIQDLYKNVQLPEVQTFKTMYDAQSLKHENVGNAQATVVSDGGGTPPPPAPTAALSASPSTIDQGQSSTLTWSSTDATSCTASGAWSGAKATSGSQAVSPGTTSSYTITCDGAGGSANNGATVTVNAAPAPVPTASLAASPSTIDQGQSSTLTWSSTDATSCTASGAWSGAKATSGSQAVSPGTTSSYTITCDGAGGSANNGATVTVNAAPAPVPTASLAASPSTIDQGQSSTLTWSSNDATSCTASGAWSGAKATSGSQSVTPGSTASYTISCNGAGGSANNSTTVTVNPAPPATTAPTVSLSASPSSLTKGSNITLTWSSTDASSCSASGGWSGSKATSGSESMPLSSAATLTLTCTGAGGSASNSVSYANWGRRRLRLQ